MREYAINNKVIVCPIGTSGEIWAGKIEEMSLSQQPMSRAEVLRVVRKALSQNMELSIKNQATIERPFMRQLVRLAHEYGVDVYMSEPAYAVVYTRKQYRSLVSGGFCAAI